MPEDSSETFELGPNEQKSFEYDVDPQTAHLNVLLKSSDHGDVSTLPSWFVGDEEFPQSAQSVDEYPGQMEALGDRLVIKIRNESDRETRITVGVREVRLASV